MLTISINKYFWSVVFVVCILIYLVFGVSFGSVFAETDVYPPVESIPVSRPDQSIIFEVPSRVEVLSIVFLPDENRDGNIDLDVGSIYKGKPVATLKARIADIERQLLGSLTNGTKYHGYKDADAPPSVIYSISPENRYVISTKIPKGDLLPGVIPSYAYNYEEIFKDIDICDKVDNHGVRQVWIWGYHEAIPGGVSPDESNTSMGTEARSFWPKKDFGDFSNSRKADDLPVCEHSYTVYGYNFDRGLGEALENHAHQLEAIFGWLNNTLFWRKFVGMDSKVARVGRYLSAVDGVYRCGWTHTPPNGLGEYSWNVKESVMSDCEDWQPSGIGEAKEINCNSWPPGTCQEDGGSSYKVWWMQNIPGYKNELVTDSGSKLRNWWEFEIDVDKALKKDFSLFEPREGSNDLRERIIVEDFEEPKGIYLGMTAPTGQRWMLENIDTLNIDNGRVKTQGCKSGKPCAALIDAGQSDGILKVGMAMNNEGNRIIFRYRDDSNYYFLERINTGYMIGKLVDGERTNLRQFYVPVEKDSIDEIEIRLNGDEIALSLNYDLLGSVRDDSLRGTVYGFGSTGSSSDKVYDSFIFEKDFKDDGLSSVFFDNVILSRDPNVKSLFGIRGNEQTFNAVVKYEDGQSVTRQFKFIMSPPTPLPDNTGFLVNNLGFIREGGSALKAIQFSAIPENKLSTSVYVPVFYMNAYDYNSIVILNTVGSNDRHYHNLKVKVTAIEGTIPQGLDEYNVPFSMGESFSFSLFSSQMVRSIYKELKNQNITNPRVSLRITADVPVLMGFAVHFSNVDNSEIKKLDVNKFNEDKWLKALKQDLLHPTDIFAEGLIPYEYADSTMIVPQAVSNVLSSGENYQSGLNIMNAGDKEVNFEIRIHARNSENTIKVRNPLLRSGQISFPKLKPLESRVFYIPDLLEKAGIDKYGFNGSLTIQTVKDDGSIDFEGKLVGTNYFARYSKTWGQGTAVFWNSSLADATKCSYDYPLFNEFNYAIFDTMHSGVAVRVPDTLGQPFQNLTYGFYDQKVNPPVIVETTGKLSQNQNDLLFLPNRIPTNSFYSMVGCAKDGKIVTDANTLRTVDQKPSLNFGTLGYSQNWPSNKWFAPYLLIRDGNRYLGQWMLPMNLENSVRSYKYTVYDSGANIVQQMDDPRGYAKYRFYETAVPEKSNYTYGYTVIEPKD